MSKRSKRNRSAKPPAELPPKPTNSRTTIIVVALIAVAAFGVWWWRTRPADAPSPVSPSAEAQTTNAPPPANAAAARPEFEKLKGKWQRPDGGYVIDIRSVDADGKLDAAYFNPKPIHVARTQAAMDGTSLKVFIELRDVNYPGSTYTLVYEPDGDQLKGIYYQALQQQSFEVNFVRMK
jgi:hypothetical protein